MAGTRFATHEVGNQSPSFQDLNLFLTDAALQQAVRREGAAASHEALAAFGAAAGSAEAFELGRLANDNPPKLRRFDQKGFPLDLIEFHPDRKSVGSGKRVSVRVDLGGRRIIKKKTQTNQTHNINVETSKTKNK